MGADSLNLKQLSKKARDHEDRLSKLEAIKLMSPAAPSPLDAAVAKDPTLLERILKIGK